MTKELSSSSLNDSQFEWIDELRSWNRSELPVEKLKIAISEVWTPLFLLANCELKNCYLLPHNRSTVGLEYNGEVSLGIQLFTTADCDLELEVHPK